jgi:hypothetical protein
MMTAIIIPAVIVAVAIGTVRVRVTTCSWGWRRTWWWRRWLRLIVFEEQSQSRASGPNQYVD